MPPETSKRVVSRPLLLGLLGLGGAGLVWLARGDQAARGKPEPAALALPAEGLEPTSALPAMAARETLTAGRSSERPALERELAPDPAATPSTEREWLQVYRELARTPGALEAETRAILDGHGPDAGKVALLRAQLESGAPGAVRWLAYAARTRPDAATAKARSVASFALDSLAQQAGSDELARALLGELAFDVPELAPALRRGAASVFALRCAESELDALRVRLLREPDALLVAGAVASLAEREQTPRVARLLLDFPPPRPAE